MKAIITDYDYTLSDKFLTVELLFLLEKKEIIQGYIKGYTVLRKEYMDGKKSYNEFAKEDMDLIQKCLAGVKYLDVIKVIQEDFKPEENVFDWAKEIRNVFKEGWIFIVISSTMDLCLDRVQNFLDFDTYFCSSYEVKNSLFSGNFRSQVKSSEKGDYVRQLKNDLEKIVVVGDAPGDFEMMRYGTESFLFEPNVFTLEELKKNKLDCRIVDRRNILEALRRCV